MNKLNEGELLDILKVAFSHLLKDINYKETRAKYEQACQQIKEMLQKPEVTEEFLAEKAKLFVYAIMPSEIEPTRSDFHAAKEFLRTLFKEMK